MSQDTTTHLGYGLAFETSGAIGQITLGDAGSTLETRSLSGPRRHAAEFLPTVAALCRDHSVNPSAIRHIYVSAGPGSFTGLRIGITAARMIALATGADIVAVPTLEVVAQNAMDASPPPDYVAVVLDAKRKRVYAAAFRRLDIEYAPTSDPAEVAPADFLARQPRTCAVLGEGVAYHRKAIEASGLVVLPDALHAPRAETVYRLGVQRARRGLADDPRRLIPVYIRPPEAEEKWLLRQTRAPDGPAEGLRE